MKFFAIGRVYPESAAVWFERFEHRQEDATVSVECRESQIYVAWEEFPNDDLDSVKITSELLAQMFVSAIGFGNGATYTVEITQVIRENGQTHFYGPKDMKLGFAEAQTVFRECSSLMMRDFHFRFAVIDYCTSITNHIEAEFFPWFPKSSLEPSPETPLSLGPPTPRRRRWAHRPHRASTR